MAKEFHQWLSDMANTIDDPLSARFSCSSPPLSGPTPLQTRMHMADLLVPSIEGEGGVRDWLRVFTSKLNYSETGSRQFTTYMLAFIVGSDNAAVYAETTGDSETLAWLNNLKQKIKNNTLTEE